MTPTYIFRNRPCVLVERHTGRRGLDGSPVEHRRNRHRWRALFQDGESPAYVYVSHPQFLKEATACQVWNPPRRVRCTCCTRITGRRTPFVRTLTVWRHFKEAVRRGDATFYIYECENPNCPERRTSLTASQLQ